MAAPTSGWQPATIVLSVMAAEDLKDVSFMGKMSTYVAAWVDATSKRCTRVLKKAGTNPVWNDSILLPVHDSVLYDPNAYLILQVRSQDLLSDSIVGTAYFPLYKVLGMSQTPSWDQDGNGNIIELGLQRPSGRMLGTIRFSFRLQGGNFVRPDPSASAPVQQAKDGDAPAEGIPVMGYPAGPYPVPPYSSDPVHGASASGQAPVYAFPTGPFGEAKPYYAPAPAQYAPAPGPYQYPVPVQPQRMPHNRNNFWAIATGILGGLLLGDILF